MAPRVMSPLMPAKQSKIGPAFRPGRFDKEFHLLYGPGFGRAHGKLQVAVLHLFAAPGQVPHLGDEKSGQGFVIPRRQVQCRDSLKASDFGAGVDRDNGPPPNFLYGDDLLVKFVGDFPDDLFQQVFDGDDAHGAAVFVHHHGQVDPLALHLRQRAGRFS